MTFDRIINIAINVVTRRVVNAAINKGIAIFSRRPAPADPAAPPAGDRQGQEDDAARRARQAAKITRRPGR